MRPEEVYAALKRLAEEENDPDSKRLLAALFIPQEEEEAIRKHLRVFRALAEEITDAPIRQKLLAAVEETPANLLVKADAARTKFDDWFKTAQDRAQQWFQIHTRGLTIGASFLIAFGFQLDAVEIFHHVGVSPAARNALVAASQGMVQQADAIVREKGDLVQRMVDNWNRAQPEHALTNGGNLRNTAQLETELRKIADQGPNAMPEEVFRAEFQQIRDATIQTYFEEKRSLVENLD